MLIINTVVLQQKKQDIQHICPEFIHHHHKLIDNSSFKMTGETRFMKLIVH